MAVSLKMSQQNRSLSTQTEYMKTLIIVSGETAANIKKRNVTNRIIDVKERFL